MSTTRQNNPNQKSEKKPMTPLQAVVAGSVAGVSEVMVDHPFWTLKTRYQAGQPLNLSPSVLYMGVIPNAASMMVITGLQVGTNQLLQKYVATEGQELSPAMKLGTSFAAGAVSASVSGPVERIMTMQNVLCEEEKKPCSFVRSFSFLRSQEGLRSMTRGLLPTVMREGKFTSAYLAGLPLAKETTRQYCSNEKWATFTAGLGVGLFGAVLSQPDDTVKTKMQQQKPGKAQSMMQTAAQLYQKEGVMGFFKGGGWRALRMMPATCILGTVAEKMEAYYANKK